MVKIFNLNLTDSSTALSMFLTVFLVLSFAIAATSGPTFAALAQNGSAILLSPNFQEVSLGQKFTVDVLANSSDSLVGADIYFEFDSRVLEIAAVDADSAFEIIPQKTINKGTLKLMVLAKRGSQSSGVVRLASLSLKPKDGGETALRVTFTPSSTLDSNLTSKKVSDVLTRVDTGKYLIGSLYQRGAGSVKRFVLKALPLIIALILISVLAYFGYQWWRYQKERAKVGFIPQQAPLDRPPGQEES